MVSPLLAKVFLRVLKMSQLKSPPPLILTTRERCDFKAVSGWINRYVFPASFAFIATVDTDTFPTIQFYETVILGTASASYLAINLERSDVGIQPYNSAVRYVDWLITTPFLALIIYEYALGVDRQQDNIAGIDRDFRDWWFAGLPVVMVAAGYLALISEDNRAKIFFFILSWLALLTLFYLIFLLSQRVDLRGLQFFFYIGWSLYGLTFLIPDYCTRATLYNVLDFFNKVVFSFYITFVVFG
jgi:hypothetical protein